MPPSLWLGCHTAWLASCTYPVLNRCLGSLDTSLDSLPQVVDGPFKGMRGAVSALDNPDELTVLTREWEVMALPLMMVSMRMREFSCGYSSRTHCR